MFLFPSSLRNKTFHFLTPLPLKGHDNHALTRHTLSKSGQTLYCPLLAFWVRAMAWDDVSWGEGGRELLSIQRSPQFSDAVNLRKLFLWPLCMHGVEGQRWETEKSFFSETNAIQSKPPAAFWFGMRLGPQRGEKSPAYPPWILHSLNNLKWNCQP